MSILIFKKQFERNLKKLDVDISIPVFLKNIAFDTKIFIAVAHKK